MEAYDVKRTLLLEEKAELEVEASPLIGQQTRVKVIHEVISEMELELKEKLKALQEIKENYMAEELLDTIETLASTEEAEKLSDMACETIKLMNLLMRKYNVSYIGY